MSDDVTELRQKLAEIERKTAIWLSMLAVFILVFLAAWIASSLWMMARLQARVEKAEKALEKTGMAPAEKRETVEAESFVVRDASGRIWASFGLGETMNSGARLAFYDANRVERTRIGPGLLGMSVPGQKKEEKEAVSLAAGEDGPALFLTDRDGKSLFSAWVSERRRPIILAGTPVTVPTGKTKKVRP
ncbi:MAG: hypothetical protein ACHQPI_04805 [Thermoanaerobaculia bacterium]